MKTSYNALVFLFGIFTILIFVELPGQDLSKEETLKYIENKLLENTMEENVIPRVMAKTGVTNYKLELEYEYLILKTYLKDESYHVKKAKLMDSDIWIKFSPENYWEGADVYSPAHHLVFIGIENLPPFAFLHKVDAERILNALNHLKKYCEKDPFS